MTIRQQYKQTIEWLLEGDPSIRWQTMEDLCNSPKTEIIKERAKIERDGWGKKLMKFQDPSGTWDNN